MTKQELILFIEAFNKKPGEYSIEDAIEIGIKMKYLPVKERSWDWLVKYLGITSLSPNALRKRVEKRFHNNFNMSDEAIEFKNKYSSQYKEREWVNAYRRLIREDVRIDNLKDEIKLVVDKLNALPAITPKEINLDPNLSKTEAVLLFSDLHIGVDCDNYYNKYNLEIAQERVNKLLTDVTYYCYSNNVQKLNILNLGDLIHGIIHSSSRIEQEMDVVEQVMYAAEILSQFLNELTRLGIEITYRSVSDNHSRVIADKNQHIEKEQFSRLIDWYVAERLKNTSVQMIESSIDFGVGKFKVFDKTIMFAHGHENMTAKALQDFMGLTREWVDYVCLGHYHKASEHSFQGLKVFVNGSIVGTEQYAFSKRLFSPAEQKLLIFEENSSNVIDITINLQ